jgi:hypothetical protein
MKLVSNQDAMFIADTIGVSRGNTLNFSATSKGVKTAYANISRATSHYRCSDQKNFENIFKDDIDVKKENES